MLPDHTTFTRDELCRVLRLPPAVIDALLDSGVIAVSHFDGQATVQGADLEQLFTESARQLHAHMQRQHEAPADPRRDARYTPRRQLSGMFREVKVQVLQLSVTGLRIRHNDALRPGEDARLSVALPQPQRSYVMRARIVWTSLAQTAAGESFYISGLRVTANDERLAAMVDLLRTSHDLQLAPADDRRHKARELPRAVHGLTDEDVASIIQAVKRFASDPAEAARWYARARFAVADENVRKLAPRGGREREEVLGVWEYLQRRVDIASVARVMRWIRSSQAHA